jgi:hypothetical protein
MTIDEQMEVLKLGPIEAWPYPRIVVGVPQERAMSYSSQVFYDFWSIAAQGVPIIRIPYNRIDVVRNKMAIELLRSEMTHLLMLDIDHKHPKNIVRRLASWVIAHPEVQVVGGLNFRRGEPFDPCCGFWGNDGKFYPPAEWEKGLIKVDIVGTGSIMIAREVFELIPPPWFSFDYSEVWADIWPGEDIGFSKLCNKYGVNLYVDTTVTSPHMIDAMVTDETFKNHLKNTGGETTPYEEFVERIAEQAQG